MKKLHLLICLFLCAFLFTLTSCSKGDTLEKVKISSDMIVLEIADKADHKFIGYLTKHNEKSYLFYPVGSTITTDSEIELEKVYVENKKVTDSGYSLPTIAKEGLVFAGWYTTNADLERNSRIASSNQMNGSPLFIRYISFGDAALVAMVCILIVFGMLALLWGIITSFKFVLPNKSKNTVQKQIVKEEPIKKQIKLEDIKDEDMMVAGIVATIDYHDETGEDVHVVSIKEIK